MGKINARLVIEHGAHSRIWAEVGDLDPFDRRRILRRCASRCRCELWLSDRWAAAVYLLNSGDNACPLVPRGTYHYFYSTNYHANTIIIWLTWARILTHDSRIVKMTLGPKFQSD